MILFDSFKSVLMTANSFLRGLNRTSMKRLVIYTMIVYPLFFGVYYRQEIVTWVLHKHDADRQVKVRNLDNATNRTFNLRERFKAEAVMLYVYQPDSNQKTHKERVTLVHGSVFLPYQDNDVVQLVTRTRIIEDLRKQGYAKLTGDSGHRTSELLYEYGIEVAYVVPVTDPQSNAIIAEVIYIFLEDNDDIDVNELMHAAQMFTYDIY